MIQDICRTNRNNSGGLVISSRDNMMFVSGRFMEIRPLTRTTLNALIVGAQSDEERLGLESVREIFDEIDRN